MIGGDLFEWACQNFFQCAAECLFLAGKSMQERLQSPSRFTFANLVSVVSTDDRNVADTVCSGFCRERRQSLHSGRSWRGLDWLLRAASSPLESTSPRKTWHPGPAPAQWLRHLLEARP